MICVNYFNLHLVTSAISSTPHPLYILAEETMQAHIGGHLDLVFMEQEYFLSFSNNCTLSTRQ